MTALTTVFIYIIKCFLTNEKIDDEYKAQFTPELLKELFAISKAHDVAQIVSEVLFKNELLPKDAEITEKFQKYHINALYRYMNIDREQQMIFSVFEKNKISFIPLKGAVIRQYYPDPYMRTSCDIDILVKEQDLETAKNALVDELKYKSNETVNFHDISLFSQSGVHLELHYSLKEKRENLDKQLVKVWDYCIDTEKGKYCKQLTPEFFVFYHITHMVNHFLRGGCGIRPFIDLYYIKKKMKYDVNKLMLLLKASETDTFFNVAMHCVSVWFENESPDEISELVKEFVLKGGTYGTEENRLTVDRNKQGGKFTYFISRIFVPFDTLKYKYPILQTHKFLLPVMWFVRLFSLILPDKRNRAKREMQMQKNISVDTENKTAKMMDILKL